MSAMENIGNFLQGRSIPGFSSKRVFNDGKSFDELFEIEGIPLFWFYKRYLLPHTLPRLLNTDDALRKMKKLSPLQKARLQISSQVLQKYILFNELRKIRKYRPKVGYTPPRKALFLTYFSHRGSDNRLYRIQGIIDQLHKDKRIEPFPLFVAPLSGSLPARDCSTLTTIYQYADEAIFQTAKQKAKNFSEKWKKIDVAVLHTALTLDAAALDTAANTVADTAGATAGDTAPKGKRQLWPYLRYAFSLFMSAEFLSLILLYYELSKKVIEQEHVAVVFISGQNGLFERCMAAAARTKGIPCLLVPHGYAIKNLPPGDILDNMYLPVFDQDTEKFFVKGGVPANHVRVTGPAMYDNIVKYKQARTYRQKKTKVENKTPAKNILLLTQPLVEDNFMSEKAYFEMVERVLRELYGITETAVAIKLHPRERGRGKYLRIIERIQGERIVERTSGEGGRISIHQQGEIDLLYQLLEKADVVVNFYATAGVLEASILDVPSLTFPFDGQKSNKYGAFDPSLYVWKIESLKPAIERLFSNPALLREKRRKMVRQFCSVVDGKASRRVAQWAYELLPPQPAPGKHTL